MPRRSSRWQLIHILAKDAALTHNFWNGGRCVPPAAFYESYSHYSLAHLEELVAECQLAPSRGRPKRHSDYYDKLIREVNELRQRLNRHSERSACEIVAKRRGANPTRLRMRYRRAKQCEFASKLCSKI